MFRACGALAFASLVLADQAACSSDFERSRVTVPTDAAWSLDAPIGGAAGDGPAADTGTGLQDGRVNEAAPFDAPRSDTAAPGDAAMDAGRDANRDARPGDARPDTSQPVDAGPPDVRRDAPTGDPGCFVVTCRNASDHSCCLDVYPFVLNAMDKPAPELIGPFLATTTSLIGNFRFDGPQQDGAIGFSFPVPPMPTFVRLAATWTGSVNRPFLTLEAPGAGCAYPFTSTWEANLDNPLFCWGEAFTPDGISFRIESTAAGDARLTITRIELR